MNRDLGNSIYFNLKVERGAMLVDLSVITQNRHCDYEGLQLKLHLHYIKSSLESSSVSVNRTLSDSETKRNE